MNQFNFLQLDTNKSLVDQCVQGEGMVQINLEVKSQPGESTLFFLHPFNILCVLTMYLYYAIHVLTIHCSVSFPMACIGEKMYVSGTQKSGLRN